MSDTTSTPRLIAKTVAGLPGSAAERFAEGHDVGDEQGGGQGERRAEGAAAEDTADQARLLLSFGTEGGRPGGTGVPPSDEPGPFAGGHLGGTGRVSQPGLVTRRGTGE